MKFQFKVQQYQTDAVDAVVKVFAGQGYHNGIHYVRDMGVMPKTARNTFQDESEQLDVGEIEDDTGFKNEEIHLSDDQLLQNIHKLQSENNIKLSPELVKGLGRCSLDVEMETGTGKTYVYIKTMFELNKVYGWSKFIVVVPSIAIREGVKKSFEVTADHFQEYYGKKARFFIYNSQNLNQLDNFSAGMAPLLIGMMCLGSVQMFFLGIIGEYVLSINQRVMHRPLVVEEERLNFE